MKTLDGYELYRLLSGGQPRSLEVNGSTYRFQFQGDRMGVWSWLLVTDDQGDEVQLAHGWSSEACWNALVTLQQGRWATPVGPWTDPSDWNAQTESR